MYEFVWVLASLAVGIVLGQIVHRLNEVRPPSPTPAPDPPAIPFSPTPALDSPAVPASPRLAGDVAVNVDEERDLGTLLQYHCKFLDNSLHDVRIALSTLHLSLDSIATAGLDDEMETMMGFTMSALEDLNAIVDNLTHANHIVTGRPLIAKMKNLDLVSLLESIVQTYSNKHIALPIYIDLDLAHRTVQLDQKYTSHIITTFFSNAIQHTSSGSIRLTITQTDDNIVIRVQDTGEGVPESIRSKLFHYPIIAKDRRVGMSLYSVKKMVQSMSGTVSYEPSQCGSIFSVKLPYRPLVTSEPGSIHTQIKQFEPMQDHILSDPNFRLLIVEDEPTNAELLAKTITDMYPQCEIGFAEDGLRAIEAVSKKSYDAVFMDLVMPNMDGYRATKEIKQIQPSLVVFAVTGSDPYLIKDRCVEAGCKVIVSKPLSRVKVSRVMTILLDTLRSNTIH